NNQFHQNNYNQKIKYTCEYEEGQQSSLQPHVDQQVPVFSQPLKPPQQQHIVQQQNQIQNQIQQQMQQQQNIVQPQPQQQHIVQQQNQIQNQIQQQQNQPPPPPQGQKIYSNPTPKPHKNNEPPKSLKQSHVSKMKKHTSKPG